MTDQQAAKAALDTLIAIGRKRFTPEAAPRMSDEACLASGLVTADPGFMLNPLSIAHDMLEDSNNHSVCAILRAIERGDYMINVAAKTVKIHLMPTD